jgi:hypothetical protein
MEFRGNKGRSQMEFGNEGKLSSVLKERRKCYSSFPQLLSLEETGSIFMISFVSEESFISLCGRLLSLLPRS